MYALILSRRSEEIVLIQSFLSKENCRHKTLSVLSDLERAIRIEFPDFLLIDSKYFIAEQANTIDRKNKCSTQRHICFADIISPVNICFPIFFFDISLPEFTQYYTSEYHKTILLPNDEIIMLLAQIQKNIKRFLHSSQNQFRPAEKKLYSLLKGKKNQSISLDQMAYSLWGCSNSAHKKTLYSYIHRIKHILENTEHSPEWLIKEKKGCYKIAIRKP